MFKINAAVIIPVYNHEKPVADVVWQSLALRFPVFIVDDGSTDSTYEKIRCIPTITILRHSQNMGKGAALLTGFAEAMKIANWAITIDADGQHHPADAKNLIDSVPEGLRPIVIGRRQGMNGEHVPWASRFGKNFSNFWVRAAGGPPVSDTQSGMRLYPLPETLALPVKSRRFQYEVEVLVKAQWYGIPVIEAPIQVTYVPKLERISHYRGFIDFIRNSIVFTRLIFGRIFLLPFFTSKKNSLR